MAIDWVDTFRRSVGPSLPLRVRSATFENEQLYVGDLERWHFNTGSSWRLRDSEKLIAGWTWPNAADFVWDLCGQDLVHVTVQTERAAVDPVLIFGNGWSLEVFGDSFIDPWTLHLPTAILVGDGGQ